MAYTKRRRAKTAPRQVPSESHASHHPHSPFFILWELATATCVMFVGLAILVTPTLALNEETLHEIHKWEWAAELILITEVVLLLLVARNKIHFIKTKWTTILAVVPFGSGFQFVKIAKVGWHALEKTRVGHFFKHPIKSSRRWVHRKLGLRI